MSNTKNKPQLDYFRIDDKRESRREFKPLETMPEEEEKSELTNFITKIVDTKKLGTGAFGVCSLCYLLDNPGVYYALKKIKKQTDTTDQIEREISILRYLKDDKYCIQNTLCFRGYDSDEEHHYILTDYSGENYKTLDKSFENEKLVIIIKNIYNAIINLHKIGVAHLDIKPGNILYNIVDSNVILIDFGGSCNAVDNSKSSNETVICPDKYSITFTEKYVDYRLYKKIANKEPLTFKDYTDADLWAFGMIICYFCDKHIFEKIVEPLKVILKFEGSNFGIQIWVYENVYKYEKRPENYYLSEYNFNGIKSVFISNENCPNKIVKLANLGEPYINIRAFFVTPVSSSSGGKSKKHNRRRKSKKYIKNKTKKLERTRRVHRICK